MDTDTFVRQLEQAADSGDKEAARFLLGFSAWARQITEHERQMITAKFKNTIKPDGSE